MRVALLVVDDEPLIRDLLEQSFSDAGYVVTSAANGREAINRLEQAPPELLIVDVNLGEGPNGWEVARRGCELKPGMPIVYITGGRGADTRPSWAPTGLILLKPFTPAQVVDVIEALLETGVA